MSSKKIGFNWIIHQQRTFEILKQLYANPLVFYIFRIGEPTRIETNVSDLIIKIYFC